MIQETLEKGLFAHQQGDLKKAETLYRKVLKIDPKNADALNLNGIIYASTGRFKKAEKSFKKAISFFPKNVDYRYSLFNLYKDHSHFDSAIHVLLELLKIEPSNLVALKSLGGIYFNSKKYGLSREYYEKYYFLNSGDTEVTFYLARCNFEEYDFRASLKLFQEVLRLSQGNLDCIFMIALVHYHLLEYPEAVKYFELLLDHQPKHIEALYYIGSAHYEMGESDAAYAAISKMYQIAPNNSSAIYKLIYFSRYYMNGYSDDLSEQLDRLLHQGSLEQWTEEPSYTIRRLDSPLVSLNSAKAYALKLESKIEAEPSTYVHGDKIHVAYLSCDFNDHPVGVCIEGLLQNHSDDELCFSLISISPCTESPLSKRLRDTNLNFYDFSELSQKELVNAIRSLNISILVDLIGYTKNSCLEVHIRKAAPVQVWYLGYPSTSGSRFVDYLISDRVCVPEESKKYFTEEIVYLDDIYHSYTPIEDLFIGPTKPNYSYKFTFGLFSNPSKISNNLVSTIGKILNQVPNSILLIGQMNELALKNIKQRLLNLGISESRLVVSSYAIDRRDYLSKIRSVDLFLDTDVYNAHSTLLDFLYMGVPTISIKGQQFAARVSESFLTELGLQNLLVDSFEEYINMGVQLGQGTKEYFALRQQLADSLSRTKMFDPVIKARQLESSYKLMWKKYLEN
ncbi:MAG: tetratricopeptide repeat protein [Candidatus Cloacimonetes bacterium]|nr:tetratricopeptide repeat protein [Candidatus Cloacimonadota bacterium]